MLAAWVDGAPASSIGLDDRGLHYGDGLFETMAASGGRVHFLASHLARLAHGCAALEIAAPEAEGLKSELARAAALAPRVVVKLIVTRGAALERGYAFTGGEVPRRIVCAYAWREGEGATQEPARVALAGIHAGVPLLAGVKHLNRLEQVLARREARRRRLDEVILCNGEGFVTGGSMTNVFALAGGAIVTPPVEHCAVAGVMRSRLLSVARELGLRVSVQALTAHDLHGAEALWLTNARVGLWPVAAFEGRAVAAHAWTVRLQRALREAATESQDA